MAKADQAMRKAAADNDSLWDKNLDMNHTRRLKSIVTQHGWPTITMVGHDAAAAAWILVQHADHDIAFQKHALKLMSKLHKNEVIMSNIAYLTDRVRIAQGKPQLFGTQFGSHNGTLQPKLIEDTANLDRRRAVYGLCSFAKYKIMMLNTIKKDN